ncbi:MAG: PorV/PorQ family protein [Ignavibacteriae bacterium]|nr:MAG: PorV/PorQ family protein [Ignavibacteriota bacterium]
MNVKKSILLIVLIVLTGQDAWPQQVAKYAGEFLSIGVGGRALGLGGAYSALANDASAGYWNPAALGRINYPEAMVMHDERFGSLLNYDFGAVAYPSSANATFGVSVMRLGVDGIPDTRNAWEDRNNNGLFDSGDYINPDKIVYFNSADWAVYFTYAQRSSSSLMVGFNLKILRRTMAEFSATGVGFDVGILYAPSDRWFLAANAQDITTTLVAWSSGTNELISPTLKLGTTYFIDLFGGRFAPTADVDVRFENRRFASVAHLGPVSVDPHVGLEFDFKSSVALRVGYNDVKQITLGAGIHLRKLDIDYSFAQFNKENDLGDTHRISLRVIFQDDRFARANE